MKHFYFIIIALLASFDVTFAAAPVDPYAPSCQPIQTLLAKLSYTAQNSVTDYCKKVLSIYDITRTKQGNRVTTTVNTYPLKTITVAAAAKRVRRAPEYADSEDFDSKQSPATVAVASTPLAELPPAPTAAPELKERAVKISVPALFKSLASSIITKQCSCLNPQRFTYYVQGTASTVSIFAGCLTQPYSGFATFASVRPPSQIFEGYEVGPPDGNIAECCSICFLDPNCAYFEFGADMTCRIFSLWDGGLMGYVSDIVCPIGVAALDGVRKIPGTGTTGTILGPCAVSAVVR